MTTYIALFRGINVGGHAILPMTDLKNLCSNLGFKHVRTYIQSGNVVFESNLSEGEIIALVEKALKENLQKTIPVIVRTAAEMETVLFGNPFPDANPSQVGVLFLSNPPAAEILQNFDFSGPEEILVSGQELYIHYPNGMGRSKLKLPKSVEQGTVRNMNTVKKLVELVAKG